MRGEMMTTKPTGSEATIVNLAEYRARKQGRTPLYVSKLNGTITASPHLTPRPRDLAGRMKRIRDSFNKINRLMTELKRLSEEERRDEQTSG